MAGPIGTDAERGATARRIVLLAAVLAIAAMLAVLWDEDLRYSLPTPRPDDLRQAPRGAVLALPEALAAQAPRATGRPLLLHFYNPDCPCSRFNRDHVQALRNSYGDRVQFVDVVEAVTGRETDSHLVAPWIADPDGRVAKACGIYSTPQALLLDGQGRIVFRGNFNASRWCSAPATQFVRQAIERLLTGTTGPIDPMAEVAYGCELPQGGR